MPTSRATAMPSSASAASLAYVGAPSMQLMDASACGMMQATGSFGGSAKCAPEASACAPGAVRWMRTSATIARRAKAAAVALRMGGASAVAGRALNSNSRGSCRSAARAEMRAHAVSSTTGSTRSGIRARANRVRSSLLRSPSYSTCCIGSSGDSGCGTRARIVGVAFAWPSVAGGRPCSAASQYATWTSWRSRVATASQVGASDWQKPHVSRHTLSRSKWGERRRSGSASWLSRMTGAGGAFRCATSDAAAAADDMIEACHEATRKAATAQVSWANSTFQRKPGGRLILMTRFLRP
eukprot:2677829-Prymnesium_polylepis.1